MSQTYLNLLDGRSFKLESFEFKNNFEFAEYSYLKKNGSMKKSIVETPDIFSLTTNGKDSIIYSPFNEDEFSIEEMKNVVLGRNSALNSFNARWAYLSGFLLGGGTALLPAKSNNVLLLNLSISVVYVAGMAFVRPSRSYVESRNPSYIGNDMFIYGYQNRARKNIFRKTLLGTSVGLVTGILLRYFIYKKDILKFANSK